MSDHQKTATPDQRTTGMAQSPPQARQFLGHPRQLVTLAGTEMWERFSFYGLQVILAYYLYYSLSKGGLGLGTAVAVGITGAYGGAIYLSQMLGAWVADRLMAPKKVVLYSAILITCGHLLLAVVPGLAGLLSGLVLIVLGTGGLKVNLTSMVGELYADADPRRDAGYSIYYMGIAIGAFLGPVLTGALQLSMGFHYAFGAAAVGMAWGLLQYIHGMGQLPQSTGRVPNPLPAGSRQRIAWVVFSSLAVLALLWATQAMRLDNLSEFISAGIVLFSVFYFVRIITSPKISAGERADVAQYLPLFIATMLFWTLLFQLFTTFAVYLEERVDLRLAGYTFAPSLVISVQSLMTAALAPLAAHLWVRLQGRQPGAMAKMAVGTGIMCTAYFVFAAVSGDGVQKTAMPGVLLGMLLFSIGEIIVVPVAMSVTTLLAPKAFKAQMTSLYFLTMAGGSALSGVVAQYYVAGAERIFFIAVGAIALAVLAALGGLHRVLGRRAGHAAPSAPPA